MKWLRNLLVCLLVVAPPSFSLEATRYEFVYQVKLELPRNNQRVKLWVPHPAQHEIQKVEIVEIQSPLRWRVNTERRYGNSVIYMEGRVPGNVLEAKARYEISRLPHLGWPKESVKKGSPHDPSLYLAEDEKCALTPTIRNIATHQIKPTQSNPQKVRALYDYIVRTMKYDKSGTGWGRGDAAWACEAKRGNCTDFHSLFIALSRSVGIPARFYIGFPIPPDKREGDIPGYHCWGEAYTDATGWIPVDASEAKKSGKIDDYYGKLPSDRLEISMGRDLILEPPQNGKPINFFVYPYAEVEGKELQTIQKKFHFKKL